MRERATRRDGAREVTDFRDVVVGDSTLKITRIQPRDCDAHSTMVFVPGFLAMRSCYERVAGAVTDHGYETYIVNGMEGDDIHRESGVQRFIEGVRAAAQTEHLIVYGHSLGAANAVKAAADDQSLADGMVLAMPAGFGGVTPHRAPLSIAQEAHYMRSRAFDGLRAAHEATQLLLHNPGRSFEHAWRAHRMQVVAETDDLRQRMPVVAIIAGRDGLIRATTQRRGLELAGITPVEIPADFAGHNAQMYHARLVAETVHSALQTSVKKSA